MLRYLLAILVASQTSVFAEDIVVLLHRDGCGPCAQAKAALTGDSSLLGEAKLALVDTQKHPLLALRYRVSAVPVLVLERDGREIARQVGWNGEAAFKAWMRSSKRGKHEQGCFCRTACRH